MGFGSWFLKKCKCKPGEQDEELLCCPRCKKWMVKKTKGSVTIDKCTKCGGIWLDKGEIFKIIGEFKNKK